MENRFILNSNECEILLGFERFGSLQKLADGLGKDISVVSRNLKSISEKTNVLEKQNGRWVLTANGKSLNNWSREAIYGQKLALNKQQNIRIATTREFASRVLLPDMKSLIGENDISVSIVSNDKGIENLILNGEADFGFDCSRPVDPLVAFKQVLPEPFVVVAAPSFIKKNKIKDFEDLRKTHLLKFSRTDSVILDLEVEASIYYGTFTDVASLRQACILGYGWGILPLYTVKQEIQNGSLKTISGLDIKPEKYGVWWLRERKTVDLWAKKALKWLKQQNLSL